MINKAAIPGQARSRVQVTFTVPASIWAERMELAIALNDEFVIQPFRSGLADDWKLTLDLPADRIYRFHYLCDAQWMGDAHADGYERDPQDGSINCLLDTKSAGMHSQTPQDMKALLDRSAAYLMIEAGDEPCKN